MSNSKFKVGDRVKIINVLHGHGMAIGQECKISSKGEVCYYIKHGRATWGVKDEEIELSKTAESLRDQGIKKAIDSADSQTPNWSQTAYEFALKYIKGRKEFMAEDMRASALLVVPNPPSNRAWGSVIVRLSRNNKISRVGYKSTMNRRAHCAVATVWEVN